MLINQQLTGNTCFIIVTIAGIIVNTFMQHWVKAKTKIITY